MHLRLPSFTLLTWAAATAVLVFLLAPIVIIVVASFNKAQILSFPVQEFSLRWYTAFFTNAPLLDSVYVSVFVGLLATFFSLLIGVPAAFSIGRYDFPGRALVSAFLLSPLLIPLIALGLAVLLVYAAMGVRPTFAGFVLTHVLITVPYVIRTVLAVIVGLDKSLEEAAYSLGADDFRTKWHITLPLIWPGMLAGAFFAFMTSLDNVPVSIFLSTTRMTTLPVQIYSQVEAYGIDPVFAAVSTVIIALTVIMMLILDRFVGLDRLARY